MPKRSFLMKKLLIVLTAAWIVAAPVAYAQIKYVAVVETDLDEQSGAGAALNRAEVRLMTAELRNVAIKNLPQEKYKIMTSETVMAQGTAKLEECTEENCVIALGNMIGADYIVRGIVSKLGTSLTMSVEMYETEDGNLVATSGVVRAENTADLLDKVAAVCADMYKTFVSTHGSSVRKTPLPAPETPEPEPEPQPAAPTAQYTQKTSAERQAKSDRDHDIETEREPMTGFSLGYSFSLGNRGHSAFQLGIVHSRPISENIVSFNVEGNILMGEASYPDSTSTGIFGLNVPLTLLFQLSLFSIEAGVDGDMVFGDGETVFNAGFVVGAGIGFSEKHSRRYFYRYSSGNKYGKHFAGMWWLF
jgi:hypothetical protein